MSETLSAEELANTVWIDNDGYPTEAALEAVATLPSPQVFEVMRRAWWMPTHGVRNDLSAAEAEMVGELEGTPWRLATGGWSGNEELIDAFQESWSWRWTWRLTAAGGLYIFDAPTKELPGGRVVPPEKVATIEALQAENAELRKPLLSYDDGGLPVELPAWTPVDAGRLEELEAAEAEVTTLRTELRQTQDIAIDYAELYEATTNTTPVVSQEWREALHGRE